MLNLQRVIPRRQSERNNAEEGRRRGTDSENKNLRTQDQKRRQNPTACSVSKIKIIRKRKCSAEGQAPLTKTSECKRKKGKKPSAAKGKNLEGVNEDTQGRSPKVLKRTPLKE